MKKITILLMVVGLFFAKASFAGTADMFNYDANKVQVELSGLDAVNQFVEQTDMSFSEMVQTNNAMVSTLSYGQTGAFGIQMLEPAWGIPSYAWGFCCSVPGVAVVYFVTEDMDETKKAGIGCAVGAAIWVGLQLILSL